MAKHSRKHRGVTLIKPDPTRRQGWRARFRDPDTGKLVKVSLPDAAARTAEARADWAVRQAQAVEKRKAELADGAPRTTGTPLADAVAAYYRAHERLRERTLIGYRLATDKLLQWGTQAGIRTTDDLTRARLITLRERLVNEPKSTSLKGGARGTRVAVGEPRSPHSVNRDLRALRAVLGYLFEVDLLPRVREGDLRRALKKLPVSIERIEFLRPEEIKALLEAAHRHDELLFAETRAEHSGSQPKGTTKRFEPVRPMVAVALLTGMRIGELTSLDWSQVDLVAGEIHLTGATKTKRARTIDLSVSSTLVSILTAMSETSGGEGRVFRIAPKASAKRLLKLGAPPSFSWQALRRTCATYLTNAPGIFGAASAYRSAKQLGHSVVIAERHYLGLIKGIPLTARTLEAAMGIESCLD